MQTFVPEYDYAVCARVLDRQRLGKQRVECLQILKTIVAGDSARGWRNHPAVAMWRGHEYALVQYSNAVCDEWTRRGYRDTCRESIRQIFDEWQEGKCLSWHEYPSWWLEADIHESHKSNLVRKLPEHYKKLWPSVADDISYVWPIFRTQGETK